VIVPNFNNVLACINAAMITESEPKVKKDKKQKEKKRRIKSEQNANNNGEYVELQVCSFQIIIFNSKDEFHAAFVFNKSSTAVNAQPCRSTKRSRSGNKPTRQAGRGSTGEACYVIQDFFFKDASI